MGSGGDKVRVAYKFSDSKKDYKKYNFEYIDLDYELTVEDGAKTITLSYDLSDIRIDGSYLYISLTAKNNGTWWYTRLNTGK